MTSEVVVMNSLAVALAADSAATVSDGHNNKIYNSANKLFMLSKCHPVGVMVYNNSALLGIPWETILKLFREELGEDEYDRLEQYGERLIKYLNQNDYLFPKDVQRKYYLALVETLYRGIDNGIRERALQQFVRDGNEPEAPAIAKSVILASLEEWKKKPDVACFPENVARGLAGNCSGEISSLTAKIFGWVSPDQELVSALRELAILVVSKDEILPESLSGLVIAGFGRSDYFPVLQMFEVGDVFAGHLKYRKAGIERIDRDNQSVVKPFAQSEMVDTFLEGINPTFEVRMIEEVVNLVVGLPVEVINAITDLTDQQKITWIEKSLSSSDDALQAFAANLKRHRAIRHFGPIRQAIINLPIDELAHVAASLVNLNLFQKRMSLRPETVGGPIDVAVISKGDGFVWIDRKHYFRRELNHHYFKNYFRDHHKPNDTKRRDDDQEPQEQRTG